MCQRIACSSCGKPTYTGCGLHVESVLGDVPASARCQCVIDEDLALAGEVELMPGALPVLIQGGERPPP